MYYCLPPLPYDHTNTPVQIPVSHTWDSLYKTCSYYDLQHTVVCATPQLWQLEPLIYKVARTLQLPFAVVPAHNLNVLKPFSEQPQISLVVAAAKDWLALQDILAKCPQQPQAVVLIHETIDTLILALPTNTSYDVWHEWHSLPSVPLLTQSPQTAITYDDNRPWFEITPYLKPATNSWNITDPNDKVSSLDTNIHLEKHSQHSLYTPYYV